jgi:hypothetical protein
MGIYFLLPPPFGGGAAGGITFSQMADMAEASGKAGPPRQGAARSTRRSEA